MPETIRVNFARSMPLFPLRDTVLLPHAILSVHVFEPRHRQMVSHCLDQSGQIAVGTFDPGERDGGHDDETIEDPAIRSTACIGQIIRHESMPGGRFNIILHGVCRARIKQVIEPDGDRAYCLARLEPIEPIDQPPLPMPEVRAELRSLLTGASLKRLRGIDTLVSWVERDDLPTHALIELIGFAVFRDTELKYRLLAEADPHLRAELIRIELRHLDDVVHRADRQDFDSWPKGMSWN